MKEQARCKGRCYLKAFRGREVVLVACCEGEKWRNADHSANSPLKRSDTRVLSECSQVPQSEQFKSACAS